MRDAETVGSAMDLYANQVNDVNSMRDALLSINKNDPNSARRAIQNITIMRVYHQLSRIIRYTELIDKIEDKMYNSIELSLQEMDECDPTTYIRLVALQEKLQRCMIESQKLLEPYLNMEVFGIIESDIQDDPTDSFASILTDPESREKLRNSAQEVLAVLQSSEE